MKGALTTLLSLLASTYLYSQLTPADPLSRIKTEKDSGLVNAYIEAGRYYSYQGKNDSAEYCFRQALDESGRLNFDMGFVLSSFRLGELFLSSGNYTSAVSFFMTALPVAEKNNFEKSVALINRDLGVVHYFQEDRETALPYFKKAEDILLKIKDTSNLINLYTDMGTCIGGMGDTATALDYFERNSLLADKKLSTVLSSKNSISAGKFSNEYGSILDKKIIIAYNRVPFIRTEADYKYSLTKAAELKKLIDSFPNPNFSFRVHAILCMLQERTGHYNEAITEGKLALEGFDADEFPAIKGDIAQSMAKAYYGTGNYKEAYAYAEASSTIKDSLNTSAKFEMIKNLAMKYEAEKKDQQISFLNEQRSTQQKLIVAAIAGIIILFGLLAFLIRAKKLQKKLFEKEKLVKQKEMEQKMSELEQTALRAQMNPHFIFNCLNSVQRYVINNDVEGANSYLSTFASLIRKTLENSGKTAIRLKDELEYLETYIKMERMRSGDDFDYSITVQECIDTTDYLIPGMIIQPFLENSILHGLRGKTEARGMLWLSVSLEGKLIFVVEDNGSGINQVKKSRQGEKDIRESMGSSITIKRLELFNNLHDEKIEWSIIDTGDTDAGITGTKVVLKFPAINR